MLGATAASYDVFKDFNKHVLQKAVKEINEITDINVTAENVRKGRTVVSIRFKVEEKKFQPFVPADKVVPEFTVFSVRSNFNGINSGLFNFYHLKAPFLRTVIFKFTALSTESTARILIIILNRIQR